MVDEARRRAKKLDSLRAQLDQLGYGANGPKDKAGKIFSADELRKKGPREKRPPKSQTSTEEPDASPTTLEPITYGRSLPRRSAQRASATVPESCPNVVLEDAVSGSEVSQEGFGRAFVVAADIGDIDGASGLGQTFRDCLRDAASGLYERLVPVIDPSGISVQDIVFMDVESTGLGSSPLFLIGIMVWGGKEFEVRQLLARNYAEEAAVIGLFLEECAGKKLLVTFNGKSFDFPFIRARAAASGVPFALGPAHLDLLHVSRRIWKEELPNCKLQTLERFICGRARHGDIPGSDIPDAYHAFVRSGNAWQMVEILKHNMLDLVTLADLMTRFPAENTAE